MNNNTYNLIVAAINHGMPAIAAQLVGELNETVKASYELQEVKRAEAAKAAEPVAKPKKEKEAI